MRRAPAVPGIGHRLCLAALHRQRHGGVALVAGHDLDFGAQHLVEHARERIGDGAGIGRGGDHLLCLRASASVRTPAVCQTREGQRAGAHGTEPDKAVDVVLHAADADRLRGNQRVGKHADGGAVLRRDRIEVVGHFDAAGADHVLRRPRSGLPGICLPMKRAISRDFDVVAAADIDPDQDVDGLAAVEIGDAVGLSREAPERRPSDSRASAESDATPHR